MKMCSANVSVLLVWHDFGKCLVRLNIKVLNIKKYKL